MEVDETTSLLSQQDLPPIADAISDIKNNQPREEFSFDHLLPPNLSSQLQTSFALVVLHSYYCQLNHGDDHAQDVWETWSFSLKAQQLKDQLEEATNACWSRYLDTYRTSSEIQAVLWTELRQDSSSQRTVRLVDLLARPCCPSPLSLHHAVYLSVLDTWIHGLQRSPTYSSPRTSHALDLLSHFGMLALVINYILFPPLSSVAVADLATDLRPMILLILSISIALRWSGAYRISSVLNILSFLFTFPATPLPTDASFNLLLVSTGLCLLQISFPSPPSILLLFSPSLVLPPSVRILNSIQRVYSPIAALFSPIFVVLLFLLSYALQDTFFLPAVSRSWSNLSLPPPIETRAMLLIVLAALLIMVASVVPVLAAATGESRDSQWGAHSPAIGQEARRVFFNATIEYSQPLFFPPPLNIAHLLVVKIPSLILEGLDILTDHPSKIERALWMVLCGPLSLLMSGLLWFCPVT